MAITTTASGLKKYGTSDPQTTPRTAGNDNADLIEQLLAPVGSMLPYAGATDPAGGKYLLADGRLVSRATDAGAAFYAVAGHTYNGGVDPGSGMVRIPDKRGRGSIGAANMGTAQGGATGNARAQVTRGATGGEATHALTVAETPSLPVNISLGGDPLANHDSAIGEVLAASGYHRTTTAAYSSAIGGGGSHNNLGPYEADNWIVRVL